jgi:hypothetical protein
MLLNLKPSCACPACGVETFPIVLGSSLEIDLEILREGRFSALCVDAPVANPAWRGNE